MDYLVMAGQELGANNGGTSFNVVAWAPYIGVGLLVVFFLVFLLRRA